MALPALLLIGFGASAGRADQELASAAPPAQLILAPTAEPRFSIVPSPGCWITGDLVGEANPAAVAATSLATCG
jgi:hypothetical protein